MEHGDGTKELSLSEKEVTKLFLTGINKNHAALRYFPQI